jgi:hypothetical protein
MELKSIFDYKRISGEMSGTNPDEIKEEWHL